MGEIVNLRRVRKAKVRVEAEAQAKASRTKHGVAKRERDLAKAQAEKFGRDLASWKLDNEG